MTPRKMINKKAFEELKELKELCDGTKTQYDFTPCLTLDRDGKESVCIFVTDKNNTIVSIILAKNIKDLTQKFEAFLEGIELNRE